MIALLTLFLLQDPVTDLGFLEVKGRRLDTRLTVEVNEDAPLQAIVVSSPVGIRCGAQRFEFDRYEAPRLCWVRAMSGTSVQLTARVPESWGEVWRVEWSGCEASDERSCAALISQNDLKITARFVHIGA
ncbi:hypothetical protein [Brevundimonas diminuta]|uniref:hypothetical protein n=1 Tax=Brevundimonas diminuta TaxID=293 RepID=UPI000FE1850D|nr:hypothetical protein [Brevundimonas diminuta]